MIATQTLEYLLVDVCAPGRRPETAGVLLYDSADNRLEGKFRRDWDRIVEEDEQEVLEELPSHLDQLVRDMGAEAALQHLEDSFSNIIRLSERRSALSAGFDSTLRRLYKDNVPATIQPYRTHLPIYSLRAAAGSWGEQMAVEEMGWEEVPEDLRMTEDMFIAQVVGRSMEPLIPDGSWCVFRRNVVGSREGKRLLVENRAESESGGQRYTVKRYHSAKKFSPTGEWEHSVVRFEPLNPEFEAWEIDDEHQCAVLAEFVRVLE